MKLFDDIQLWYCNLSIFTFFK